jgi:hypothetical protein
VNTDSGAPWVKIGRLNWLIRAPAHLRPRHRQIYRADQAAESSHATQFAVVCSDAHIVADIRDNVVVSAAVLYRAEREISAVERTGRRSVVAIDERVSWRRP